MTDQEQTVLIMQGAISELPPEQQKATFSCIEDMNKLCDKHGHVAFCIAIGLAGAILQKEGISSDVKTGG